ncbi:ABC transporter permease subunit [Halalkalicoccus jeotgali]|uniref:Inner-membrane translocator n=1 Tax=Halalkalicoccus jeotgali (strain DSM 18796 / CECT 7217 / JCM 14584 / KCTC 4019 / B3) TaxID=795797 RepID=D8J7F0_HALJB|nr:urea ABC transporter permease [Halalkalicoccus jeotgali]ADJ14045.1 inner-membrane translocator [Halalkalicoccus jeotgali B3]ELY33911.1 inner-membrane translocator [Halalkalicoccus jeotgali B3]
MSLRTVLDGPNTRGTSDRFWAGFGLAVFALLGYPLVASTYAVANAALFLLYAILGLSLCVIWGYCGILSFGQVAFFGIGGYTFGIVGINLTGGIGPTLGLLAGIGVATLFAFVLGYFMFYGGVRDVYVTIMTLVVALVIHTFMGQTAGSEWAIGEAALGGFDGMTNIPNLAVGGVELIDTAFYYVVLLALLGTYLGLRALVNSDFGRAMVAVREDEERTELLGYDTKRIKLLVFTLGGTLAGLSGVLYASWGNYMNPAVFGITFAALPVVWVSVGGRDSLLGAIGATYAVEWFSQQLSITGNEYALVVVGGLLLVTILWLPEGVAPAVADWLGERTNRPAARGREEVAD